MSDDGLAPGKRLSEIRQQLGLSQRRAAELSGLTHSAISTIEQDKVSPAISTLQKLLKVYGLSLSEFFAEPEKPDEPQVVINQDDLIEIGSQEGEVILTINGQTYHLVAGQSYAINTGIPHSFSNPSAGICRIISAHTPTTF